MRPDAATAVRRQLIAALEQRAAGLDGTAKRMLDARLAELRERHVETVDESPGSAAATSSPGPLGELLEGLARRNPPERSVYPELPALADFRQRWSALRADSRLQQSVAHAPTGAGPLNSAALASRAIAMMRELSPGYLHAFLGYVDDLAWLEQLAGAMPAATPQTPRKRAARKPRA
ncbi:DUF2894 domain-containing protein [Dyella sp. A6]|uniref:DUF2894 domain-containing protein n=1 Tax=Dyella aluminiiresistens TaxID=3069105 RepID=UPI002E7A77E8|nr:DUF2894 domain-containing protein [Dyella sp. A6]